MRAGSADGNGNERAHPCSQAHSYVRPENLVSNAVSWIHPSLQPSIRGAKAYLSLIKQMPELQRKQPENAKSRPESSLHPLFSEWGGGGGVEGGGFGAFLIPALFTIVNCFVNV